MTTMNDAGVKAYEALVRAVANMATTLRPMADDPDSPLYAYFHFWELIRPRRRRMMWGASGLSIWLSDGLDAPSCKIVRRNDGASFLQMRLGPLGVLYTLKQVRRKR